MSDPKRLTILCMAYNEQAAIPLFYEAMRPVVGRLAARYRVDLLFMNNASTDGTLAEILKLRAADPHVYVVTLSRNAGYQGSVDCGLRLAKGDLLAIIDVDCEDPPELIETFVERHEQGYDIVYGERLDREEWAPIKAMRKVFYRVLRAVADDDILLDMAEFSLFTAEVRDAVVKSSTSYPFIRAAISRVGFHRTGIPFKRRKRIAGETHYNLLRMTVFAVAGILASSTLLLRLPLALLPVWLLALAALGAGYAWGGGPGYALAFALTCAGYVGATLAFIALYVARGYKNGLLQPNAHVHHRYSAMQSE